MNEEDTTELVRCSECGELHPRAFCHELAGGRWVCDPCALKHGGVRRCDDCFKLFLADELTVTHGDEKVCEACFNGYIKCAECGEYYRIRDLKETVDGDWVCEDCRNAEYVECAGCGKWVRCDEANGVDGEYFCNECYADDDYVLECRDCGECHIRDNMTDVGGDHEYRWVCDDCFLDYDQCQSCGEWFRIESDEWINGRDGYCEHCCEDEDDGEPCIHDYHWGHGGWFRPPEYLRGEKPESTLTYGVEIEMAEGGFNAEDMCDGDELYHFEYDGSLHGGDACELITQPGSLAWHKETFGWPEVLAKCIRHGYVSHNAKCSCGFHVHIGRQCLSACDELKLDVWFNRYAEYWKHIARRKSPDWGRMDIEKSMSACCKSRNSGNNHSFAVNHGNRRTVEIRVARGTLKAETVLGTLEAYDGVVHYLRNVGCYDLYNNITKVWQGYLQYLAGRPKEYEHALRMIERLHSYKVTKEAVSSIDAKLVKKDEWIKKNNTKKEDK